MRTLWYSATQPTPQSTKGAGPKVQRPKLSKDARAALAARRKASRESYAKALRDAAGKVNNITEEVATATRQTICRVARDLHMEGHLSRKRHQKPNAWNAFLWSKSQENGSNGME